MALIAVKGSLVMRMGGGQSSQSDLRDSGVIARTMSSPEGMVDCASAAICGGRGDRTCHPFRNIRLMKETREAGALTIGDEARGSSTSMFASTSASES